MFNSISLLNLAFVTLGTDFDTRYLYKIKRTIYNIITLFDTIVFIYLVTCVVAGFMAQGV